MFSERVELRGHLIDSLILPKVLDEVLALGGNFRLQEVRIGQRREEPSYVRLEVEAPDRPTLDRILGRIKLHGAEIVDEGDAALSSAPATHLLMCPPNHYGIEYEINPWMDIRRQPDHELAQRQWRGLYEVLTRKAGAQVEMLTPLPGLPDLVFTANAGWAQGKLFIAANFRYEVRARETPHLIAWFQEHGYEVVRLGPTQFFEGEGDILPCGDNLFAGYRFRSDIRSHLKVGEILGRRVLSLELVDPRFYHLDTCFLPLGGTRAAYFPGAFDEYGRKLLREYISEFIEVSEAEALRFACNAVVIGQQVVMNAGCPTLKGLLEARGYTVHETPLDEFLKSGGSAKCLVLFVRP